MDGAIFTTPHNASRLLVIQRVQRFAIVAVLVVFGLILLFFVRQERTRTLERERARLLTQIRVIDANLAQQLEGVNAALFSTRPRTALSSADQAHNAEVSATLHVLSDVMPAVRTMLMIDAQGKVLSSSRPEILGFDASQRAYFQSAKSLAGTDTLSISAPFTTVLNVYSLSLAKAWTDGQNRLMGVTTATLDPVSFSVLLRSVLYADDMRATLIHSDGVAFVTLPPNAKIQGANLSTPGSLFLQHKASGQTESFHTARTTLTGEERLIAFRTVRPANLHMDKPLILAVSRDLDTVLAPWRNMAAVLGGTYALVCALSLGAIYFLRSKTKALQKLEQAHAKDVQEQAERLDLALSGGNLGLFDLDMRTGVRTVNARVQEMIGDAPDDPVDTSATWAQRRHPQDQSYVNAAVLAHERGETGALAMDYRIQHKDGHWVWIHSRARITRRDADGRPLRMVGTYQDISERKAAEAQIAEFAFYDPLTKLPNRRLLMDRLQQAQMASTRGAKHGAVLFMDLDYFKKVNDTLGHDVGDELLCQVAQRLQLSVRQIDTVARLGGDEFVLVLEQLGDTQDEARMRAVHMAHKILSALGEPFNLGGHVLQITSSVGVAVFFGESAPAEQLLKQADQALYSAKTAGRNQAVVYASDTLQTPP